MAVAGGRVGSTVGVNVGSVVAVAGGSVGSDVAVRACVRIEDVIDARPEVVIVVASGDGSVAVKAIAALRDRRCDAFVVVVVTAELRAAEWRLRELGASAVLADDVGADVLAEVCRRALETTAK